MVLLACVGAFKVVVGFCFKGLGIGLMFEAVVCVCYVWRATVVCVGFRLGLLAGGRAVYGCLGDIVFMLWVC